MCGNRRSASLPEIAVLDPAPFLASGDPDEGLIERFLERATGRERDRHISGLENALRRLDPVLEARGDQILKRADAVDDRVGLPAVERGERGGEIVERRVAQMTLIEIFRSWRMSDRREALAGEIGLGHAKAAATRTAVIRETIEVERIEIIATLASIHEIAMTRPAAVLGVLSP